MRVPRYSQGMRPGRTAFLSAALLFAIAGTARAFKNNQHDAASNLAVSHTGSEAADIQKFKSLIVGWSYGINYSIFGVSGFAGKPAEQLAHVGDQRRDISTVFNNNGDFAGFLGRARQQYLTQNFGSELAGQEGAYVLLGTCLHLIEDQSSPPHGANVLHQSGDHFEGPLFPQRVEVGWTGNQGNVTPDSSYAGSLSATQAKILLPENIPPSPLSPQFNQYWVMNDQLRAAGNQSKSAQRYAGQYSGNEGVDPAVTGAYGGQNGEDIFTYDLVPGLYQEQGTQATDFAYNFLLKMSKSFRPVASGMTIGGAGGATPSIINSANGSPVRFKIVENRLPGIDVRVFVQETGQAITASNSVLRIAAGRGANGAANETQLGGPTTWDNLRTALFDTKADDMTLLPFEADFELTWKGEVVGQPLADGTYNLCVVARDLDSLSSPGPTEGRSDTCVSFAIASPDFSTRTA